MTEGVQRIADTVRVALESADLDEFADLLDPKVTWGAPGDPSPPCQTRRQVLAWYQRGRAEGRRARVLDVSTHGDKILISMTVTAGDDAEDAEDAEAETLRWQVLTVANDRVVDIRGYDDEQEASAAVAAV
jgi:hypothetical protein